MLPLLVIALACSNRTPDAGDARASGFGVELGRVELPPASAVWIDARRAFACTGATGVYVVDIADPYLPKQEGVLSLDCQGISGESGRIHVATGAGGLQVVHPGDLLIMGTYTTSFEVAALAVDAGESAAFLAGPSSSGSTVGLEKVWTYSAENLASARMVELDPGEPLAVATDRDGVYLARSSGTLEILGVSLEVRASLDLAPISGLAGGGMVAQDAVVWLAGGSLGLSAIDVLDLAEPQPLAGWQGAAVYGLAILDDRLYLGSDESLWVLDISDPTDVVEVGMAELPGITRPEGIYVLDGQAAVVDAAGGALAVVDIDEDDL